MFLYRFLLYRFLMPVVLLKIVEDCLIDVELSKSVELCRKAAQTVGAVAQGEEYTKDGREWIADARNRLAQRLGRKPATKAGLNPLTKAPVSAKKTRAFEYPPGPPDESKLI